MGETKVPNLDLKHSFLTGHGLKLLAKELGSRQLAIGSMVEFWELASEYWSRNRQLIPVSVFKALEFPAAILNPDLGFAEVRDDGIYAKGSSDQFEWLASGREAKAINGRKGGLASAAKRLALRLKLDESQQSNDSNELIQANASTLQASQANASLPIPIPIPIPVEEEEEVRETEKRKAKELPTLAKLWNRLLTPPFGRVLSCGPERTKKAGARWKENASDSYWLEVFSRLGKADLAKGKGDSGWVMDFDFFIKPETATKILEGKYDKRFGKQTQPSKPLYDDEEEKRMWDQRQASFRNGGASDQN